jgi:hypothetical protein
MIVIYVCNLLAIGVPRRVFSGFAEAEAFIAELIGYLPATTIARI